MYSMKILDGSRFDDLLLLFVGSRRVRVGRTAMPSVPTYDKEILYGSEKRCRGRA